VTQGGGSTGGGTSTGEGTSPSDSTGVMGLTRNPDIVALHNTTESFKPGEGRMEFTYTIKDTLNLSNTKLEIFRLEEEDTTLVTFYTDLGEGEGVAFKDSQDDDKLGWSGKGTDGELVDAGAYLLKITAAVDESFENGFEDLTNFEIEQEEETDDNVYDYFVTDDDAWLRKTDDPGSFITPTEKAVKGTRVAMLEQLEAGGKQVAKLKIKETSETIFITNNNKYISRVETLENTVQFAFAKEYQAVKFPYSETASTKTYKQYEKVSFYKECGDYLRVLSNLTTDLVEGYWAADDILREPISDEEIELIDDYSKTMSPDVSDDYLGFVEDFKKDGYFAGDKEPLSWMNDNGLDENEITFLGMKVSKIITPFREVLEETEKNLKKDYPAAYNEILTQYSGASALVGQAQIRYIGNSCNCNPSNHSLGAAIDIRPNLNPQITSSNKAYIEFIKYMTGLDLTKSKTAKQVTDAQEAFMMKFHGQKTKNHDIEDIIADYEDANSMTEEFDLLSELGNKAVEIEDFQKKKLDFIAILKAHKNRLIFESPSKKSIDAMIDHLQSTTGNSIAKKTIANWDKVVQEKKAFLEMVKNAGLVNLNGFITYFGKKEGQLAPFFNVLLEKGFGETRIELVNSFHKAHQEISKKYNDKGENGEWGGNYSRKYDGMHFGLKTSFIKALTSKK